MRHHGIALVLSLCGAQAVHAADILAGQSPEQPPADAKERGWVLQLSPYVWAAGLDGRISPFRRGPAMDVDKSFSDVMSDFNIGGFINLWARRDRLVLSADVMYVSTTGSEGTGPLPAFQIPGLGVPIPPGATVDAGIDSKQFMATLMGGYRIVDQPAFTLDALGGARIWQISNTVSVTASHAAIGTRSARHGESFGWVEPLLGARAFAPLGSGFSVQAQADIGGFGAGSDLSWSVLGTVNYSFSSLLSASLGYKALGVDYDHGGHRYDMRLTGPVLGLTFRF